MAKYYTKVEVGGNAGRDAEVRTVGSKEKVSFSVACGGGKSKNGDKVYPTVWLDVEAWGVSGASEVGKGDYVEVKGWLKAEEWTDKKTGQKRSKTVLVATSVNGQSDHAAANPGYTEAEPRQAGVVDEDIPF